MQRLDCKFADLRAFPPGARLDFSGQRLPTCTAPCMPPPSPTLPVSPRSLLCTPSLAADGFACLTPTNPYACQHRPCDLPSKPTPLAYHPSCTHHTQPRLPCLPQPCPALAYQAAANPRTQQQNPTKPSCGSNFTGPTFTFQSSRLQTESNRAQQPPHPRVSPDLRRATLCLPQPAICLQTCTGEASSTSLAATSASKLR